MFFFIKIYGFLSFAKYMGKNIGKNISRNLSCKHSPRMLATRQKLIDHTKEFATDALKTTSKTEIQKAAQENGYLMGNRNADRIIKVSKNSKQNNSETVTNEHDKEIPKKGYRYISRRMTRNY